MKLRVNLKSKIDNEIITIYPTIENIINCPIDTNEWEIIYIDRQVEGYVDSNGKELFENDIIRHTDFEKQFIIEYSGYRFRASGFYCGCYDSPDDMFSEYDTKHVTVIGRNKNIRR